MKKDFFKTMLLMLCAVFTFAACSDDDDPILGSEAAMISFSFDPSVAANSIVTSQPVIGSDNSITYTVSEQATEAQLATLVPTVVVSAGATYTASGSDFSKEVTYKVVSEDGQTTTQYVVKVPGLTYPIEEQVAGTYKGLLNVEMLGNSLVVDEPKNITVTKNKGNAVDLLLTDFSFQGMPLGDIQLDSLTVTLDDKGVYTFTGNQGLTLGSGVGDCTVETEGTVDKGAVTAKLAILWMQQTINVTYTGERLTGDESGEAKMTAFSFTGNPSFVAQQPVINDDNTITFGVSESTTDEQLKSLQATVEVSAGATYKADGTDFSKDVTYTVVAENGTVATYVVKAPARMASLKYSFDEWESVAGSFLSNAYDKPKPTNELASSAEGAGMLKLFGVTDMPIYKSTDDKVAGAAAARLVTMDTSAQANSLVPAITSGSVFTGWFDMSVATTDKLSSTRFGIAYDKKPLRFKGYYKYTPGEKFIDGTDVENIVTKDQTDECAIQAVLYEAETDDFTLTGHDINNSDKRVAVAALSDGTAKAAWTSFDIPFTWLEGKTYDPAKKYKLAIVCSSSKEGDLFKGAGGSTLLIDEFEVVGEAVAK